MGRRKDSLLDTICPLVSHTAHKDINHSFKYALPSSLKYPRQEASQQDHNSEARNTHRNQKDTPLTPLSNFDDILQKEPSTIQPTAGYASAHACNLHTKQRLPKEVGVFEAESVFVEIEL